MLVRLSVGTYGVQHNTYGIFEKTFLEILDKQAPLKTKILRHNNNSFTPKELWKNIMLRSKLKKSFNKDRSYDKWCKYKRQRNFRVNLLRITKRNHKPYFIKEGGMPGKITLAEIDKIIHKVKRLLKLWISILSI